jgi:hypothetical protein
MGMLLVLLKTKTHQGHAKKVKRAPAGVAKEYAANLALAEK